MQKDHTSSSRVLLKNDVMIQCISKSPEQTKKSKKIASLQITVQVFWCSQNGKTRAIWFSKQNFRISRVNGTYLVSNALRASISQLKKSLPVVLSADAALCTTTTSSSSMFSSPFELASASSVFCLENPTRNRPPHLPAACPVLLGLGSVYPACLLSKRCSCTGGMLL